MISHVMVCRTSCGLMWMRTSSPAFLNKIEGAALDHGMEEVKCAGVRGFDKAVLKALPMTGSQAKPDLHQKAHRDCTQSSCIFKTCLNQITGVSQSKRRASVSAPLFVHMLPSVLMPISRLENSLAASLLSTNQGDTRPHLQNVRDAQSLEHVEISLSGHRTNKNSRADA